ncbi:uncharacterized protein CMU_034720 [Cryptosporidium muris RN66]|uniref:PNPLA domain-containing protein n=1 Tax=Cryptosporidium muris (strain RN66) TaxID=441375 RepID=B6AFU5_CRYMR|nr:uncharacterized protein CMU_034720 [Cryptosporidium muris RN66]EEA07086.1 hypothetical protein, conserved [Cryptosporidium muris RN66]|eukprot:XP_002141435.1 hypothetical protein [Cryptosporidium muris RN66]
MKFSEKKNLELGFIKRNEYSCLTLSKDNLGASCKQHQDIQSPSETSTSSSTNKSLFWPNSFEEFQKGSSLVFNRLTTRIEEGIQDIQQHLQPDFPNLPPTVNNEIPIGFSFSVSALLIPYHLGVILELQEQGYITDSTPLSGASGGSIAALCCGLGISMYEAMEACITLYNDCRENGTAGRLNAVLEKELRKRIPENAIEILNNRAQKGGQIIVSYTQLLPVPKPQFVSEFYSYEDLVECILASSTIPFLSVTWPTVQCRGKPCLDGFFAVGRSEFGCPPTNASRTVKVCPLPTAGTSMKSKRCDVISPHIQDLDWILFENISYMNTRSWIKQLNKTDLVSSSRESIESIESKEQECSSLKYEKLGNNEDSKSEKIHYLDDKILENNKEEKDLRINQDHNADIRSNVSNSEISVNTCQEQSHNGLQVSNLKIYHNTPATLYLNNNPNPSAPPIMKYSTQELLRIAVDAPSEETAWELFYVGRGDALRWTMIDRIRSISSSVMEP